jgi:hypothetical protein
MKAFPKIREYQDDTGQFGMDLRDYFAAKAMQSFLLDHEAVSCENSLIVISSWSYQYADAMMEARKK